MQMRHGFARVRPVVKHEAIAALLEAEFLSDFSSFKQQVTKNLVILGLGFGDAHNGLLGDDQNVGWRLRLDVAEGAHQIIFIDNVRGNFAGDNCFKECFPHDRNGWLIIPRGARIDPRVIRR